MHDLTIQARGRDCDAVIKYYHINIINEIIFEDVSNLLKHLGINIKGNCQSSILNFANFLPSFLFSSTILVPVHFNFISYVFIYIVYILILKYYIV